MIIDERFILKIASDYTYIFQKERNSILDKIGKIIIKGDLSNITASDLNSIIPFSYVTPPTSMYDGTGKKVKSCKCYAIKNYNYTDPFSKESLKRTGLGDIIHEEVTSSWNCFLQMHGYPKEGYIYKVLTETLENYEHKRRNNQRSE